MTIKLRDSLSFRQAMIAVSAALTLGVIFSIGHIYFDFQTEKSNLNMAITLHLDAATEPASQAAFMLDEPLGQRVSNGLLAYPPIFRAQINDELGTVLVDTNRPVRNQEYEWYVEFFVAQSESVYSSPLTIHGRTRSIGTLTIWVDNRMALLNFFDRTGIIIVSGIMRSLTLAAILIFVFYVLLTKRMEKIINHVSAGASRYDQNSHIDMSDFQRPDELSVLSASFNRFVDEQRESETRFKDFAEVSADWFWEMDRDLKFTYFSERYAEVSRFDRSKRIGTSRIDFVTAEELETYPEKWANHQADLDARRPFSDFEYISHASHLGPRYVIISGKPIFDTNGAFIGYRGTGSDTTEQNRLANQLRQSQKMEAVGQLTGGVAHDFNNLLGVMLGNIEIMEIGEDHTETSKQNIELIKKSIDTAASLTNRLLSFSRRQSLSPVSTNIANKVDGLVEMLGRTLGEAVDLKIQNPTGVWPAIVDQNQFESALVNLAINSRDAMPRGGVLIIETANATLDEADVLQYEDVAVGDYVKITVRDTGTGIPPKVIEKVFEPFFTTKDVGAGSGLGLSMVYGFVKQSKGHISISSEDSLGTIVTFYLPRSLEPPTIVNTVQEEPVIARGSGCILLVEDDENLRKSAASILRNQGYDVVEAVDGNSAMIHLNNGQTFDLLFSDIVLPDGINGVEIADKAVKLHPGLRVLFATGYAVNVVLPNSKLDLNANVLNKPYRRVALLNKIRLMLNAKSVLLIDDNVEFRTTLCRGLEQAGFDVVAASGGIEGLALSKSQYFDVVVTDIIMPEGEGVETLGWMAEQCPGMPVIAISGHRLYLDGIKDLGAAATLKKPFKIEDLIGVIRQVTSAHAEQNNSSA